MVAAHVTSSVAWAQAISVWQNRQEARDFVELAARGRRHRQDDDQTALTAASLELHPRASSQARVTLNQVQMSR